MPKIFLFSLIATIISIQSNAQTAFTYLDANNVNGTISNGAVFFNSPASSTASYEYPATSGNHLIYANAFWFSGKDANGQIKIAAQKYDQAKDLFPGPLTTDGVASISAPVVMQYDQIWTVSKVEVDNHIANYMSGSYVMPNSISTWPAHGDVSLNQDYYLAPFVDYNNNGTYDPINGDYPLIRGDEANYMILNDKASAHLESGGEPIGIECHFMFYQYSTADALDNTTFINVKLINRGTQTLYDFSVGSFLDADLGDSNDDYMGCDSSLNLLYAYNATNSDINYGANPPAVGIVSLNHELGTAGVFSNVAGAASVPSLPIEYQNNMTGYFNDGSPRTLGGSGYGGAIPNKFQFHGNPNNAGEWSEYDEMNVPGERRMFFSTETITLVPNAEICYDFAVVVGDGGTHLGNVNNLMDATSFVQNFFDNQDFICENFEAGMSTETYDIMKVKVYPQPASDGFKVDLNTNFDYEIFSIEGKLVVAEKSVSSNSIIGADLNAGAYLLKILTFDNSYIQKIIIE